MMHRRNLLLLGGAAALVLAAVLALNPAAPPTPVAVAVAGGLAFPGLAARLPDVRQIELRRGEEVLVLERKGDRFVVPARGDYPARQERVREALVGLTELRLIEPRTAEPAQYERLGTDDPMRVGATAVGLRLLDDAGRPLAEMIVGRRRVRTQGNLPESVYVRRPGEAQSWLAEGRLVVDVDPNLWIDRDVVNLPASRLQRATLRRHDAPELVIAASDGSLRVVTSTRAPIDDGKVEEIGRALEYLTFQEVVPESQVPGEPIGEARFQFRDNLTVLAWPSRTGQALWLRLRAEGNGESQAEAERLDARWRGWAYQVGAWKERGLLPRLDELAPEPPATPPPQPSR